AFLQDRALQAPGREQLAWLGQPARLRQAADDRCPDTLPGCLVHHVPPADVRGLSHFAVSLIPALCEREVQVGPDPNVAGIWLMKRPMLQSLKQATASSWIKGRSTTR